MTDVTKLKLYPLTAWDEVSFSRRMARVLALILPDVGDLAAAEALLSRADCRVTLLTFSLTNG